MKRRSYWLGPGAGFEAAAYGTRRQGVIERFRLRQIFDLVDDLPDGEFTGIVTNNHGSRDSATVSSTYGNRQIVLWEFDRLEQDVHMVIEASEPSQTPRSLAAKQKFYRQDEGFLLQPSLELIYRTDNPPQEQNTLGLFVVRNALNYVHSIASPQSS